MDEEVKVIRQGKKYRESSSTKGFVQIVLDIQLLSVN